MKTDRGDKNTSHSAYETHITDTKARQKKTQKHNKQRKHKPISLMNTDIKMI
jgi:hypothetical protein